MRRRLLLAAFLFDGLCTLAAPLVLPALFGSDETPYRVVGGTCIEVMESAVVTGADAVGREVDPSFCS